MYFSNGSFYDWRYLIFSTMRCLSHTLSLCLSAILLSSPPSPFDIKMLSENFKLSMNKQILLRTVVLISKVTPIRKYFYKHTKLLCIIHFNHILRLGNILMINVLAYCFKKKFFNMTKQASFSTQMRLMIKYFFDKRTNLLSCILDWLIFLTNVLASCAALFQQNFMIYL